ncbi:MAG: hypothetical protein ACYDHW_00245 [Syntrophorhabdaceae bacterium]
MDTSLSLLELAELLLVASFEETENLGHTSFFISVTEVAANLGVGNHAQIVDACHLLEEKGCILLAFDHASALSASITPEGEAYVEKGGETGIIGEYQRYRANAPARMNAAMEFETASPTIPSFEGPHGYEPQFPGPSPHAQSAFERDDNTHIFASIEMLVKNNTSLHDSEISDLLIDVRMLELQLSKASFQKPLADAISADLKKLPGLAPLIELLFSMKS